MEVNKIKEFLASQQINQNNAASVSEIKTRKKQKGQRKTFSNLTFNRDISSRKCEIGN